MSEWMNEWVIGIKINEDYNNDDDDHHNDYVDDCDLFDASCICIISNATVQYFTHMYTLQFNISTVCYYCCNCKRNCQSLF